MADTGYVLVVAPDRDSAPTTLFFRGLVRTQPDTIRIAQYRRDAMPALIGGAAAVVFSRGLFEFADIVKCAAALGIPRYYFLDDHFILVREQGGDAAKFAQAHTPDGVRRMLNGFAAVLASTPPLQADFVARGLHPEVKLFPPMAIEAVSSPARRSSLHIAFFGGSHLHDVFHRTIVPAIRRLASARPVTLIAVGAKEVAPSQGLTVTTPAYEPSYLDGVKRLASEGVDVLVHPVAAGLLSNPFKNPHALITANALGAVPVVSNGDPYAALRDRHVAILCDDSESSWHQGLMSAIDSHHASEVRQRLAEHCRREYNGAVNARVWQDILSVHSQPLAAVSAARSAVAAAWLSASWIRRGLSRVTGSRTVLAMS